MDLEESELRTLERESEEDERAEEEVTHEGCEDEDRLQTDARQLRALVRLCAHTSKSSLIDALVCSEDIRKARAPCVDGSCTSCGFRSKWSQGYRRRLFGENGELCEAVSPIWTQRIRWQRLRAGNKNREDEDSAERPADENEEQTLKETVEGTAIKLLDDFEERVARKAIMHRHTWLLSVIAAREQHEETWPLILVCNSDYPENGELLDPRQLQSDYWKRVYYSLFMSITGFLFS